MKRTIDVGIFRVTTVIVDLILVYASLILAFFIVRPNLIQFQRNFNGFLIIAPYIGFVYLIFMYIYGLEKTTRQSFGEIVYSIILTCISLFVAINALAFIVRNDNYINRFFKINLHEGPPEFSGLSYPRTVMILGIVILFITMTIWRYFVWKIKKRMHGVKPTIVIGRENAISLAKKIIMKHRELYGIKYISSDKDKDILSHVRECSVVFITSEVRKDIRDEILKICLEDGKSYYFVPNILSITSLNAKLSKVDDIPTYRVKDMELNEEEKFLKRAIDIIISLIGIVILSPVFLILYIILKIEGGSAFYTQDRVTINGKIFKVYKFRSMKVNAEKNTGPVLAGENDPRITKIGKIIRATRLDEIPQLFNILKGEMSIVGPRPERPIFVAQHESDMPEYVFRKKVKSGLTGMAQILGKYNTTPGNKLRYDLIYIENYSILLDFKLMFQTLKILLKSSSTEGVKEEDSLEEIIEKFNLEITLNLDSGE